MADEAQQHGESATDYVRRQEFQKLEEIVHEQATNIIRLTTVTEQSTKNLQGVIQGLGAIQDQQTELARAVGEVKSGLDAEQRPKGIPPAAITGALTIFISVLSVGGVLVYQHVHGVTQPLVTGQSQLRSLLEQHVSNGHPHSVQAEVNELRSRFDDHVKSQEKIDQERAAAELYRQSLIKDFHTTVVANLQIQIDALNAQVADSYRGVDRDRDMEWIRREQALREEIERLRKLIPVQ